MKRFEKCRGCNTGSFFCAACGVRKSCGKTCVKPVDGKGTCVRCQGRKQREIEIMERTR